MSDSTARCVKSSVDALSFCESLVSLRHSWNELEIMNGRMSIIGKFTLCGKILRSSARVETLSRMVIASWVKFTTQPQKPQKFYPMKKKRYTVYIYNYNYCT